MTKTVEMQSSIFKTYLDEYCEVNGIPESALANEIAFLTSEENRIIAVVGIPLAEERACVKIGFHTNVCGTTIAFGTCMKQRDKYPKTTAILEKYGAKVG